MRCSDTANTYDCSNNVIEEVVAEHLLVRREKLSRVRRQCGMGTRVRQYLVARLGESDACDRPERRMHVVFEAWYQFDPLRSTGIRDI